MIKLIECPRDAMQGIKQFIPTEIKQQYINTLLDVGFDTLDFGSFVSPKAIPQMRDTAEVLKHLHLNKTKTKLLAIIANIRGAEQACAFDEISYLGFPFSISEVFQMRNANASIEQSLNRVDEIQKLCIQHNKTLVVYISMAFGNPYNEKWSPEIAIHWSNKLANDVGIKIVALSDTIGVSNPENIQSMFSALIPALPQVEFGAHLHTQPHNWREKIEAAYKAGCLRFDGAIKGFGGCPMAADKLTGNMPMEHIVAYFTDFMETSINKENLQKALLQTGLVFH